ncbi:MAG: hypothetical protein ACYDBB_04120 [Armatimonadota bacterium]
MSNQQRVVLVTDLESLPEVQTPELVWMVRPHMNRKYSSQRMVMIAEVVDLHSLNLERLQTFETL